MTYILIRVVIFLVICSLFHPAGRRKTNRAIADHDARIDRVVAEEHTQGLQDGRLSSTMVLGKINGLTD